MLCRLRVDGCNDVQERRQQCLGTRADGRVRDPLPDLEQRRAELSELLDLAILFSRSLPR